MVSGGDLDDFEGTYLETYFSKMDIPKGYQKDYPEDAAVGY